MTERSSSRTHSLLPRGVATAALVILALPVVTAAQDGGIASPNGETYSVTHRLGRDPILPETEPTIQSPIFLPDGVPDDIVTFDGFPEDVRTYAPGTTPTIDESIAVTGSASYTITIISTAPTGEDLFPSGYTDTGGHPLPDGYFTIGLDDTLNWTGANHVQAATLTARHNGAVVIGPLDVTSDFSFPWDGLCNAKLEGAAGQGIDEVELQFFVTKDINAPENDDCSNASTLMTGQVLYSNVGANTDGPEELLDCNFSGSDQIGSDIWYDLTASCTGDLKIDLCESGFDTKMAVYDGCGVCPVDQRPIACNDDSEACGANSRGSLVNLSVTQGSCFTVRIGGYLADQGSGKIKVTCRPGGCCVDGQCISNETADTCASAGGMWFAGQTCGTFICPPPPPENDLCENCIPVDTGTVYEGSTEGATGSAADSSCSATDSADVWHCWTADCDGFVTIGLCDSPFDTTLAVFDACDGTEVACNDDACQIDDSKVQLQVTSGEQYVIRVAGVAGATGDYRLDISDCMDPIGACCSPDVQPYPLCFPTQESTCLQYNGTFLGEGTVCRGDLDGNGVDDACETCNAPAITSSVPSNCAIDARYPTSPNDAKVRFGWDQIELTLDCEPAAMAPEDFAVTVEPSGPAVPVINSVDLNGSAAILSLAEPIPTGAWTCFQILSSGSKVCFGNLPADVDNDGSATASDILEIVDNLNGIVQPPLSIWQCDTDRSGVCNASDILGVIDLLNGAGAFDPWQNETLSVACPTAP